MKTYKKAFEKARKIEQSIPEIPWDVWTTFWEEYPSVSMAGDCMSFGNGDYQSEEQIKRSLEWFVTQFGGEISWS